MIGLYFKGKIWQFLHQIHGKNGNYRPNIRPKYSAKVAEYSVSADTTFDPIGRTLIQIILGKIEKS